MKSCITVNGIHIEIERKKIKNLHLHVSPSGRVYASAPLRTSEKCVIQFIRENMGWIGAQLEKYAGRPDKEWYEARKGEFEKKVAAFLPKWEAETQLFCSSWHTRYMTSRWGSCVPSKKRLCFNLQLYDRPEICLEYVILHELLHLKHPGHGADFKADLDRFMPDWRSAVRMLE